MSVFIWSQTAANNATADSTINWAEGQAPSTINDSARAMMAALAKYRDDIAGAIITGGTSTAYTITSNSSFDTLSHLNGQLIAFTPHTSSGATVTLNVDGLGAKPLRVSPGVELAAGSLVQGTPYFATYNNSDGAFYLHGASQSAYSIPLGGMLPYIGSTAPNSSFALPYGQAISRTTYASLFALCGTTFGIGDGSTTFNLPDMRGRLPVALDTMGGAASGRVTTAGGGIDGTTIGATGGSQAPVLQIANLPNFAPSFTGTQQTWSTNQTSVASPTNNNVSGGVGFFVPQWNGTPQALTVTITPAGTVGSINGGVTQTGAKTMPPSIVVPYLIRII